MIRLTRFSLYTGRASLPMFGGSLAQGITSAAIAPGDTIIPQFITECMGPPAFWNAVTTIIFSVAISMIAMKSF